MTPETLTPAKARARAAKAAEQWAGDGRGRPRIGVLPRDPRPPLAYLDSMRSGLVPCRVLALGLEAAPDGRREWSAWVQYTADRNPAGTRPGPPFAYAAGVLDFWNLSAIVPRAAVRLVRGRHVIGPYAWADLFPGMASALAMPPAEWPALIA